MAIELIRSKYVSGDINSNKHFLKSIDLKCTFRLALHGGKFGSYSNEKYYQEEETLKIFAYT